ncbi:GNAT family N-acetyltransferase [Streptomyces sp. NPDC087420]|uniref:GNAT family N-acetyltransferase n=1 Tax=Streptomyces sp. NPDC087420 TaxID=3365785 RepID=UPI0038393ED1
MSADPVWSVRPLRAADVDGAVELLIRASAADIRHLLRTDLSVTVRDAVGGALVAEGDGRLVGAAKVTADPVFPGTATALVAVDPAERGRGIGTALADRLMGAWERAGGGRAGGGGTVSSMLRDDLPRGRAFAERYGFGVVHHSVGFRFDLCGHEGELAARAKSALEHAGVQVRLATMLAEERTIVDCFERCGQGLPLPLEARPDPRAWLALCPPDTVFLLAEPSPADAGPAPGTAAVTGTVRPEGMTILFPRTDANSWHVAFTGTDPDHRGQGVATAVKAASLLYACRAGVETVTTHNDESNHAMIRVNTVLGMVPDVGYWTLTRTPATAD